LTRARLKAIWSDPVWSKVIARIIEGVAVGLVAICLWFRKFPVLAVLQRSIAIPVWLLLTAVLCTIAVTVLYRRHRAVRHAAADQKAREGKPTFDQIVLQLEREHKSARNTPELTISYSSPQGGMHILPSPSSSGASWLSGWFYAAATVANKDDASRSACDLTVSLEFSNELDDTPPRRIERAIFKDAALTFPNKRCCLEAGHSTEVILAVWTAHDAVQTIRAWSSAMAPLGEELYPGIWWCRVTVQAQGIETSERFRFKIGKNTMSRQMLPPPPPGTVAGDVG
jgi:hypothetical protein